MASILITGANRGLGLEFTRQYAAEGDRVLATCRDPAGAAELAAIAGDVTVHALDVTDLPQISALAESLHGEPIDILVNNAGVLTSGQRMGGIDYAAWEHEFKVNTMGPIAVAQAFLPHLERGTGRRMAFISSILGSIGTNADGAYTMYRSTKAGLNAAVKSLAVEVAAKGIIVLLLHPGWVRTDMGGPEAAIDPATSVGGLRRRIAAAGPEDSGCFISHEGVEIPW
ncbi:MAG: SDR family oxidoreductase [Alphaproteobacteria bacterium]|nr:SDR family oxidoreductase [Alphaproteobacteria bacterium]